MKFGSTGQAMSYQWGLPNDISIPQDFDGDGITDYATWRPSDGSWHIHYSSTGQEVVQKWGFPEDIPVSGDFDGDGKADYAIWRPTEGNLYVISAAVAPTPYFSGGWTAIFPVESRLC